MKVKIAMICSTLLLSACSTIVEGRNQEITINTNPASAKCILERGGIPLATIQETPSSVNIEKTKNDIVIKCSKPGYETATYYNKSGSAGATFGNIILGGGIGWAVDSASGADNKYDSPVNITLSKK